MFEFITRKKILETIDVEKKKQLEQVFRENKIDFIVRKRDIYHRNVFDIMKIGELMTKAKYAYIFWVKKNQSDLANVVIKNIEK